jgi:DNA polymerase III epsilon subunit-like protein
MEAFMNYIVFDLEFNQDIPDPAVTEKKASSPFEILQIGAVKLDANWNTLANFNRLVKPTLYSVVSPFITELTGITTDELQDEETFPAVFQSFLDFLASTDTIFVSWGKTDIRELYHSVMYHQFDLNLLPKQYIDIQPYASLHLHKPPKKLLRLQYTVEALCLPQPFPYHNALHDAYYTAEVF